MGDPQHWNQRYSGAQPTDLSWYESTPALSLEIILSRSGSGDAILDVGAGASTLVDALLDKGYSDVTTLDISDSVVESTRLRLSERACRARLLVADVATWTPLQMYDLWHDRAAFHFMTEETERAGYKAALLSGLRPGGTFIVATYAHGGPAQCSGLPVRHYNRSELEDFLGEEFVCHRALVSEHKTPAGKRLPFHWGVFERRSD